MLSLHNHIGLLMLLIIMSVAVSVFDDEDWPLWIPPTAGIIIFSVCEAIYWGFLYFFIWN